MMALKRIMIVNTDAETNIIDVIDAGLIKIICQNNYFDL